MSSGSSDNNGSFNMQQAEDMLTKYFQWKASQDSQDNDSDSCPCLAQQVLQLKVYNQNVAESCKKHNCPSAEKFNTHQLMLWLNTSSVWPKWAERKLEHFVHSLLAEVMASNDRLDEPTADNPPVPIYSSKGELREFKFK